MATFNEVCVEVVFPTSIVGLKGVFFAERGLAFQGILNWLDFDVLGELVPNVNQVVLMINFVDRVRERGLLLHSLFAFIGIQTYDILKRLCIPSIVVLLCWLSLTLLMIFIDTVLFLYSVACVMLLDLQFVICRVVLLLCYL